MIGTVRHQEIVHHHPGAKTVEVAHPQMVMQAMTAMMTADHWREFLEEERQQIMVDVDMRMSDNLLDGVHTLMTTGVEQEEMLDELELMTERHASKDVAAASHLLQ